MSFSGVLKISVLSQRKQIFIAPLLFSWVIMAHHILEITISSVTLLLIGGVIAVYQQFNSHLEDVLDGFFDYCRFNGMQPYAYAWGKSISVCVSVLLPMLITMFVLGVALLQGVIIFSQWTVLSICVACTFTFNNASNPLVLLLAWIPLLTAPLIFMVDFLNNMAINSLLILIGCDIILLSTICIAFVFQKS